MPAKPRSAVFAPDEVGIYHCYNRIVRRRHLFGWDLFTKKDYAYRKDWVREQLRLLAGQMAIEILDYAVLDNHLHTVLRNRPDIVERWSDEEVARRWWRVRSVSTCLRHVRFDISVVWSRFASSFF